MLNPASSATRFRLQPSVSSCQTTCSARIQPMIVRTGGTFADERRHSSVRSAKPQAFARVRTLVRRCVRSAATATTTLTDGGKSRASRSIIMSCAVRPSGARTSSPTTTSAGSTCASDTQCAERCLASTDRWRGVHGASVARATTGILAAICATDSAARYSSVAEHRPKPTIIPVGTTPPPRVNGNPPGAVPTRRGSDRTVRARHGCYPRCSFYLAWIAQGRGLAAMASSVSRAGDGPASRCNWRSTNPT